jgi:hypothetical protein
MSGLVGKGVSEPNIFLRFFAIIFIGTLGMGIVLSWRSSILLASDYQEIPISRQTLELREKNQTKQQKALQRELRK